MTGAMYGDLTDEQPAPMTPATPAGVGVEATRWRTRPVEVEARRVTEETLTEVAAWCNGKARIPSCRILLTTVEGENHANVGDWIVKYASGGFTILSPDLFAAIYEPVAAPPEGAAKGDVAKGFTFDEAEQLFEKVRSALGHFTNDYADNEDVLRIITTITDAYAGKLRLSAPEGAAHAD